MASVRGLTFATSTAEAMAGQKQPSNASPIIVDDPSEWQQMLKELRHSNTFLAAKFVGKTLHIITHSELSFTTIEGEFQLRKLAFHTFALMREAAMNVVLQRTPC